MKPTKLIRELMQPLRTTPFHPQWFVFKDQKQSMEHTSSYASGFVLDVGAGQQEIKKYLHTSCYYISIDYYFTSTEWYRSKPNLYADAQHLPIQPSTIDTVLLLDVLEHIPSPDNCLASIYETLKPGGKLILQAPFLYPLHDEPFDFHRWTPYTFHKIAGKLGFTIVFEEIIGSPLQSAALLFNIAISKTILNWYFQKQIQLILVPLMLPIVPICNIFAWLLTLLSKNDSFMPHSIKMVWVKQQ